MNNKRKPTMQLRHFFKEVQVLIPGEITLTNQGIVFMFICYFNTPIRPFLIVYFSYMLFRQKKWISVKNVEKYGIQPIVHCTYRTLKKKEKNEIGFYTFFDILRQVNMLDFLN